MPRQLIVASNRLPVTVGEEDPLDAAESRLNAAKQALQASVPPIPTDIRAATRGIPASGIAVAVGFTQSQCMTPVLLRCACVPPPLSASPSCCCDCLGFDLCPVSPRFRPLSSILLSSQSNLKKRGLSVSFALSFCADAALPDAMSLASCLTGFAPLSWPEVHPSMQYSPVCDLHTPNSS